METFTQIIDEMDGPDSFTRVWTVIKRTPCYVTATNGRDTVRAKLMTVNGREAFYPHKYSMSPAYRDAAPARTGWDELTARVDADIAKLLG